MRSAVLISTVAALALAGCGRDADPADNNAAADATNAQAAAAPAVDSAARFLPGRWSATIRIDDVLAPNMPPQMAEQMKRMFAAIEPIQSCLKAEEASKPAADFFLPRSRDNCRYDKFTMRGGAIDAQVSCTRNDARQAMRLEGSYSPETYNLLVTTKVSEAHRPETVTMKMSIAARRTGECDGSEIDFKQT